jgi:soluble lytic murein transglycosylase-like protein
MAATTLLVPVVGLPSPTKWGSRAAIKGQLEKIWKNYGTFISNASANSNIPKPIIASFIAVESGGNPNAGASGHVTQGLMQWNRNYAKSQLEKEYKNGRMTEGEKAVLKKYGVMTANNTFRDVTNADQLKPELNIAIGSIVLGQLLDESWAKSDKGYHLDRVIAVYNAGAYGSTGKMARQLTTPKYDTPTSLAAAVNPVTRAYISKVLAKDGAMDIATSDLKNVIV